MTEPYYSDESVTLYHGDCLEIDAWLEADVLVTDPPYGTGSAIGYGRRNLPGRETLDGRDNSHGEIIANDSDCEFRDHALAMWGDRPVLVFASPRRPEPPIEITDRLVWDKCRLGMNGGPWRYAHECIFVAGNGWVRVDNSSASILRYPTVGTGTQRRAEHIHAKPIQLMARLIAAAPDGTIADPFAGSGSTLVAAKQAGRKAIGVELEERYCEVIAKRLAQGVLDFGEGA